MLIWLKYKSGVTETSMRFDAAICEVRKTTERAKYDSLRSRKYAFLLSVRTTFLLEIGADELQAASKKNFMDQFYIGELQFISLEQTNTTPTTTFVSAIIAEEGDAPFSYLENWDALPEYSLTLIATEAD